MKDIKNKELQECKAYVPASVRVINVTSQKVMCASPSSVRNPFGGGDEDEI